MRLAGRVWRSNGSMARRCFFFQAEDGIRDVAVTGVQTCALPILVALVGEDAHDLYARIREVRVPLEPGECDAVRRVELALLAQQLPQPQEHQAVRILGELGGERLDLVSHAAPLPRRPRFGPPSSRGARRRAAPVRPPSARRAAPTDPTAPPLRRSAPWRRARSRDSGAPRRAAGRAAAPAAARPPPRRGARPRGRYARAAGARWDRAGGHRPPAPRARAPARAPGARARLRPAPRARPDRT